MTAITLRNGQSGGNGGAIANAKVTGSLQIQTVEDLNTMGALLAKSGFFQDCRDASQACVKIMAGLEIGVPPFAAMNGIHVIQGRATIGAGLLASKIKASRRYNYRVIEHSADLCRIQFFEDGEPCGVSDAVMAEIKAAKLDQEWDKSKSEWRQKYNWKSYPKNMLFARAISNGVKFYCPDLLITGIDVVAEEELRDRQETEPRYPVRYEDGPEWIAFQAQLDRGIRAGDSLLVGAAIDSAFASVKKGLLPLNAREAIDREQQRAFQALNDRVTPVAANIPAVSAHQGIFDEFCGMIDRSGGDLVKQKKAIAWLQKPNQWNKVKGSPVEAEAIALIDALSAQPVEAEVVGAVDVEALY